MKIGVIGLGLIGGSIYKSLKDLNYDLIGISNSQSGKNISNNLNDLKSCKVIFVCTHMNKTLEILDKLEPILKSDTIVTDVCSLKEFVCKKERPYKFIPAHPMAGTENSGFENSFKELFINAKWAVCVNKNCEDAKTLIQLIEKMGAIPIFTTPQKHDEAVALISHMPMVVAQALFLATNNNELAINLASSGFRDMTRLALSNEEMAKDMINLNNKNIENAILKLYSAIGDLIGKNYPNLIKEIKEKRSNMF